MLHFEYQNINEGFLVLILGFKLNLLRQTSIETHYITKPID